MTASSPRPGYDAATDSLWDSLLLALKMHEPKTFAALHENFTAISPASRARLPEEHQASFDARHKVLAEKLEVIRRPPPR